MYKCPCCGYYTIGEKPPGTYEICPVCFWEDDHVQFNDPNYSGGANELSLNASRKNFKQFGASEKRFISNVRPPEEDELKGEDWF